MLKAILAFLATPLMESVAKVPMLKPPITKTNVLKMDNNFKGAVALYDYIIAYRGPGYTVETNTNNISPFRGELADELAEVGGLVSFLAYEYGLGIKQDFKAAYLEEEENRKREEIKKRAESIAALKRRLEKSEISPEEYALTLEKQLRDLEGESARAAALAEEVAEYKEKERSLSEKITQLNEDIEEQRQNHFNELQEIKRAHEDEMHSLIVEHERKVDELRARHAEEIQRLSEEAKEAEERHQGEIAEVRESAAAEVAAFSESCSQKIAKANEAANESHREYERIKGELDGILESKRLAEARVKALGGVDRDYTDKESFNELEREYNAFTKVYKEQWAKTKKRIRKEHLNVENLKKRESDDSSD